jgi:hypothetical protein
MSNKTFDRDYLGLNGFVWFIGVVEDIMDPLKTGRVKVRCYDWHVSNKGAMPTKDLPWAQVMMPANNASASGIGTSPNGLKQGSWVLGFFLDGQFAQRPLIMGSIPGIPSYKADENTKNIGFNDPEGRYPTVAHEPDTNRLARNDANNAHGVIASKNDGRSLSVPTAMMDPAGKHWETDYTWNEPASAYAAVYPNNHVFATQSGHITEFDDTTHNERIHEYHKTGTFYEIDKAGIRTTRIVANNYTIIAGDDNVHIKGICNLTIDSHCHTYIKGNWKVQVNGNKYETIHGNNVISVHKNQTETVNNAVTETYSDTFTQSITKTKSTTVGGNVSETYNSSKSESVSSDVSEDYGGDQITKAGGDVEIEGTNIHLNKDS